MNCCRTFAAIALVAIAASTLAAQGWRETVSSKLKLMGHRNWLVVADSAYPQQSNPGILTIETGEDHMTVLKAVVAMLKTSKHVRPITWIDEELAYVPEKEAPGVEKFRKQLKALFGQKMTPALHEDTIHKLDEAGKVFNVIILKTKETIPYTSVFFQLNCAYWSDADEKAMRDKMAAGGH